MDNNVQEARPTQIGPWKLLVVLVAALLVALLLMALGTGVVAAQPAPPGCGYIEDLCEIEPGNYVPCLRPYCPICSMSFSLPTQMTLGQTGHLTAAIAVLNAHPLAGVWLSDPLLTVTLPISLELTGPVDSTPGWEQLGAPTIVHAASSGGDRLRVFRFKYRVTEDFNQMPNPVTFKAEVLPLQMGAYTAVMDGFILGTTPPTYTKSLATVVAPVSPDDFDGDGLPNTVECPFEGACPDSDGDGSVDRVDLDSDNDLVRDLHEHDEGAPAAATIGPIPPPLALRDTDGDGAPDFRDANDDNDALPTSAECPLGPPCPAVGIPMLPDYRNVLWPQAGGQPLRYAPLPIIRTAE